MKRSSRECDVSKSNCLSIDTEPSRRARFVRASRWAILLVATAGCAADTAGDRSPTTGSKASAVVGAASFTRGALELSAVKLYTPLRFEDAHVDTGISVDVALPHQLQVTMGNAGTGTAVLSMAGGASGAVECTYRGGSSVAHPTDPADIQAGTHYLLDSCIPVAAAGDAISATTFDLHVVDGDVEHMIGATGASVRLAPPGAALNFPVSPPPRPMAEFEVSSAVGLLRGQSHISVNGEFTYEIQIPVPAGRAGLQPNLSLQYRSRGGDGMLGIGWKLTGFSQITRCPSTIATEGHTDGVGYGPDERFCLDGAKLIAINGTYGADGTEYRTEEDSFQRIVSYGPTGSPSRFTVWARDGRILEFGIPLVRERFPRRGPDGLDAIGELVTHSWMLSEIANRSDSKIRFGYDLGDSYPLFNPDVVPREILYVRDTESGTELERAVRFEFEDRPDESSEWVSGVQINRTKRLTRIRTFAGAAPVGELRLAYTQSTRTNRTLLTGVMRCDGAQATGGVDPVCLQSKVFGWDMEPTRAAWSSVLLAPNPDLPAPSVYVRATRAIVADIDGDGRDDVVYQVPATGSSMTERVRYGQAGSLTNPSTLAAPFVSWDLPGSRAVDIDSDGRTEILARRTDRPGLQLLRANRTTSTFGATGPFFESEVTPEGAAHGMVDFADVDGDGLLDAFAGRVIHPSVNRLNIAFYRNNPAAIGNSSAAMFLDPVDLNQQYCPGGLTYPRVTDITGDGRSAWLLGQCPVLGSGAMWAARMDRAGALSVTDDNANLAVSGMASEFVLADLNGDGLKDAVFPFYPEPDPRDPTGPVTDIKVRWNTGYGFGPAEVLRDANASAFGVDVRTGWDSGLRVADVNGDGRDDLIQFVSTGTRRGIWVFEARNVHRIERTAFRSYQVTTDPGRIDMTYGWKSASIGDFDGDGMVDILAIPTQATSTFRTHLNTTIRPDLLTLIADSKAISSSYRYFTSERVVYSTQLAAPSDSGVVPRVVYPQRAIKRGIVVVREHYAKTDGLENKTLYSYADARADMLGRGFLGFGFQWIVDVARGTKTEIRFGIDARDGTAYPLAGRPVYQSETLSDTVPTPFERTKTTTIVYRTNRSLESAAVYSVFPEDSDVVTKEQRSGTLQTLRHDVLSQRWDTFGNEASRFETTDEGTNTVRRAFAHNADASLREAWLIGLPNEVRTTSTVVGIVEARERLTRYGYDASGQLRDAYIEPEGDDTVRQDIHYDYGRGVLTHVLASAPGVGPREVVLEYDDDGVHPRRITDPLGHVVHQFVDPGLGVTTYAVDANGVSTWYAYDGFGRLRGEANEGGGAYSVTHAETAGGKMELAKHVAGGGDAIQHVDSKGRVVGESSLLLDGRWASRSFARDNLGRVVRESRPLLESARPTQIYGATTGTTFAYDLLDRLVKATSPDNKAVSFTYLGRTTVVYDELNHQVSSTADSLGRVVERHEVVTGLGTRSSSFHYGHFGTLASISHTHQPGQTFTYDVLGRRTGLTDPDAGSRTFNFNGFGDVTQELDAGGRAVTYERDALGRVVSRTDVTGASLYAWDTAPHGVGLLAASKSVDGVLTRLAYDYAGRPERRITSIAGADYTATTGYDSAGRMAFRLFPVSGMTFGAAYAYSNGELLGITSLAEDAVYLSVQASNADGRLERVLYGNGVTEKHAYDATTGRLVTRDVLNAANTVLLHQSHTYDARGLLATRAATGASETFAYDEARRLTRHAVNTDVRQYTYDLRGNLLQGTRTGSPAYAARFTGCPVGMPPHQPCSATERVGIFDGSSTFTYDENGRQTGTRFLGANIPTDSNADDTRTIDFNSFDLPRSIYSSRLVDGGVERREYLDVSYDALGARAMQRSFSNVVPPLAPDAVPDSTQIYIGDDFEVREEAGTRTQHAFVKGPEGITIEFVFDANGAETLRRHLHADLLGSVDMTTIGASSATGALESKQRYEAYGARLLPNGSPDAPPVGEPSTRGFTGHYHDASFGLINMRGRMYDPVQRRFVTPDPVSVNAAGSYSLRSGMTSSDPIEGLGATPYSGAQGRDSSAAAAQGAPGGSSAGGSDGASFSAPGLSGATPSMASASRRPGAPRAVGLGYANAATSHSWEGFNPYSYAYNSPTNFTDPDGYDPVVVGAVLGGVANGLRYAFTAPTSLSWGQFAMGATQAIGEGALVGAAAGALYELALPLLTAAPAVVATPAGRQAAGEMLAKASAGPLKNASGPVEVAAQTARTINNVPSVVDPNRLNHVFGQARHNLEPLVVRYGSQHGAFEAISNATQAAVRDQRLTGVFQIAVSVGGVNVTVRGAVVDGSVRIGTAFAQ
jgi:RHS repeat-associated protein